MKFDILYKKTSTGAIQFWDIWVEPDYRGAAIFTKYGQLDTNSPQITRDIIYEGKNIGKKNETSCAQQAELEAQSKWERQKKKGYVESIEAAHADELDDLIEGGIVPMLAHTFEKQGHKIKYPCYVQPKLDGIRCIAIVENSKCTLWSRTRKKITSCPHIVKEIENNFKEDVVLDGELYNHEFKDNFEHIVHLVRQEEPDKNCTDVQYHIYDLINEDLYKNRYIKLYDVLSTMFKYLNCVPTFRAFEESDVSNSYTQFKNQGYEGAMLRNVDGLYVNKRSTDLIKVKEFEENEFEITNAEEGRGRLTGHVGAFVCRTKDGQEFKAKMSGDTRKLREYFLDSSLWKAKYLTVQYQGLTSYGIPRFPIGKIIRDYE